MMNTGENIKTARQRCGLTQVQLAEKIGVSPAMLCQIERGSKAPSLPLAVEIARALGCSLEELAG